jgi:hypothetical protein
MKKKSVRYTIECVDKRTGQVLSSFVFRIGASDYKDPMVVASVIAKERELLESTVGTRIRKIKSSIVT